MVNWLKGKKTAPLPEGAFTHSADTFGNHTLPHYLTSKVPASNIPVPEEAIISHLKDTWGTTLAKGTTATGQLGGKLVDVGGRSIDTAGQFFRLFERPMSGVGRTLTTQALRAPAIYHAPDEAKERNVSTGQVVSEIIPIYNSLFSGYEEAKNTVDDLKSNIQGSTQK